MSRPAYLPPMPVMIWAPYARRHVYVTEREAALLTMVAKGDALAQRKAHRRAQRQKLRHPGRSTQSQWRELRPDESLPVDQDTEIRIRPLGGYLGNQRHLAALTGYSRAGVAKVLATMRKLGILGVMTQRGRLGFTRLKLQAGVRRVWLNAHHVEDERQRVDISASKLASISQNEADQRPAGTSRFLRIDPPGMARAY